jgi:hypothetical protein
MAVVAVLVILNFIIHTLQQVYCYTVTSNKLLLLIFYVGIGISDLPVIDHSSLRKFNIEN